jgi:enamine deaminase RidA (YjgF/YER057c/UK114 family)
LTEEPADSYAEKRDTILFSGNRTAILLPLGLKAGEPSTGDFEEQTTLVLANIKAVDEAQQIGAEGPSPGNGPEMR